MKDVVVFGVGLLTVGFASGCADDFGAVLDFDMMSFLVGWSPSFGCPYFDVFGAQKASKNLQFGGCVPISLTPSWLLSKVVPPPLQVVRADVLSIMRATPVSFNPVWAPAAHRHGVQAYQECPDAKHPRRSTGATRRRYTPIHL